MALYELIKPKCTMKDLFLPEEVISRIDEILEDHNYQEALLENGLSVRRKILLHGPPGCGKTSLAHALAHEMKIPLYSALASEAIASHLGESEKNTAQLFQFAALHKCVFLIDEFDSLAFVRGEDSGGGSGLSNNRVVNTILTNMETKTPLGLLVACTNLYDSIDKAVLRRFDVVIEIPEASRAALKAIADSIIEGRFGITSDEVLAEAATPSAVVRKATDLLRRKVISEEKERRENGAAAAFEELRKITNRKPKSSAPVQFSLESR